jgi:hypothetical protein
MSPPTMAKPSGWRSSDPIRRAYPIELRELPFEGPLSCAMSWHRRYNDVAAHRWLRETIIAATATL